MRNERTSGGCQPYGLVRALVNAAITGWLLLFSIGGAAASEPALLILGDSLTVGQGLDPRDALPAQLEKALRARGRAVRVVGAGVSGDTTAGGRSRLDWSLAAVEGNGLAAVIVALGGNDGLRGISPVATEANLNAIVARLKEKRIPALVAGMRAPPNLGASYAEAFDSLFARVAANHDALLYPFVLDGVAAKPHLNQPDGIHPNAQGVKEMVRRMLPRVEQLLDRSGG